MSPVFDAGIFQIFNCILLLLEDHLVVSWIYNIVGGTESPTADVSWNTRVLVSSSQPIRAEVLGSSELLSQWCGRCTGRWCPILGGILPFEHYFLALLSQCTRRGVIAQLWETLRVELLNSCKVLLSA